MRLSRWFFGLAATGTISGAIGSGCGSSNKGAPSPSDSGSASTPEVTTTAPADAFVCMPEALASLPDSGIFTPGCQACVTAMCATDVEACSSDCTCGSTLNQVNTCLATQPAPDGGAAAGIGNIFGGGGLGAAMCFTPLLLGGGGIAGLLGGGGIAGLLGGFGGALGGGAAPADGGAADGGAASGSPTTKVIACLATTCGCLGALGGAAAEAGTDAAPAPDSSGTVGAVDAAGQ
jgi:hypothetical protein